MKHHRIISVIGLGYVGLTTAVAFSRIGKVIAFDVNQQRISELKKGHDRNDEVADADLQTSQLHFTSNPQDLKKADFHIVTVPTPLNKIKHPDLSMLLAATEMLGQQLKVGDIVVYESTVYPGATEEECIPLLEQASKLTCGVDFAVGFSPERINPADKEHVFQTVVKVVSATDPKSLDIISSVYKTVVKAGVFPVSTLRIAEACKVIENTQRDVNIALINDVAIMLHKLGMEMKEVIAAMNTKWNHLNFKPGLVGGHCIGINSYYLMHKAKQVGYHSDIIAAGRRVNESISKFIVSETVKQLIKMDIPIKRARVAVLGLTYKENCSDIRDTRVTDIISELQSYDIDVLVHDPIADRDEAKSEYAIELVDWDHLNNIDAMIITVAHQFYKTISNKEIIKKLNNRGLLIDINEMYDPNDFNTSSIVVWRL